MYFITSWLFRPVKIFKVHIELTYGFGGKLPAGEVMKQFLKKNPWMFHVVLFLAGAIGYGVLELLWRGHTHWSMLLAGGLCLSRYYRLCIDSPKTPLLIKCFFGAVIITCVELMFGTVFNVFLRLNVWNYTNLPFHFFGQICLPFFGLWFLLCIPLTVLCNGIYKTVSQ